MVVPLFFSLFLRTNVAFFRGKLSKVMEKQSEILTVCVNCALLFSDEVLGSPFISLFVWKNTRGVFGCRALQYPHCIHFSTQPGYANAASNAPSACCLVACMPSCLHGQNHTAWCLVACMLVDKPKAWCLVVCNAWCVVTSLASWWGYHHTSAAHIISTTEYKQCIN